MKSKRNRNLSSKDLKTRNEAIIYENGKPIYRAFEKLGDCTNQDLNYFLAHSFNYQKF